MKLASWWCCCAAAVMLGVCVAWGVAAASGPSPIVVTYDDVPPPLPGKLMTVYSVQSDGSLVPKESVPTSGFGVGGGYFGENRIAVLNSGSQQCVYVAEGRTSDIVGIFISNGQIASQTYGSATDTGLSNGIGLAMNSQYLYVSFSDDSAIGTFAVEADCSLTFIGDTAALGLKGGIIDGMHIGGNIMVVTYGDGSIESFDISGGTPVSNGDEQYSTASSKGNTYPTGVDITQDSHYAIFGDTSTSTTIEVSDISSGKLTPTVVYHPGTSINSSNVMLSPDETLLYISNSQGDSITAAFFDKTSGAITTGCTSAGLKGYVTAWSYVAGLALAGTTGTGGTVYVAEFGAPSSIGIVNVSSSAGKCTLTEAASSPQSDPNSNSLLSIGAFPSRTF